MSHGAPPSAETQQRIVELLGAAGEGRWDRIEVVDSTGSTNADLVGRAHDPGIVGTVRITTDQVAGRGRHARVWSAPAGGQLAISAVLAAGTQADTLGWLSLATGVAAAQAIERASGVRPVLKWPNDVLVNEKKVAGILAEFTATDAGGVVVVGIGINTNMTADDLPVPTATSLLEETGTRVDVARLAAQFLLALAAQPWPADIASVAARYRERCDTLGRRIRLSLPGDRIVEGTAVDVDRRGRIVVDTGTGEPTVAAAGDVLHLRPVL
ncbi:MAG: biotin--[acetyl-CoA-carboxylase] ligase [Gordonia sp. (in: high G+C Gram-positive bacteria)]